MRVTAEQVETLFQVCEERRFKKTQVLEEAGVSLLMIEGGVDPQVFSTLVKTAIALTNDPDIGFHYGIHQNLMKYGVVGAAALASSNALEAMHIFAKYLRSARSTFLYLDPVETGEEVEIKILVPIEFREIETFIIDAAMAGGRTMGNAFSGNSDDPGVFAQLKRDKPAELYQKHFPKNLQIEFNSNENSVRLSKAKLLRKNPYQNSKLLEVLSGRLKDLEQKAEAKFVDYSLAASEVISEISDDFPTKAEVANRLRISERTLTRKLTLQGTSYHDILAEHRKVRAKSFLLNSNLGLSEIAVRLGYSDAGNFGKAFKRWYGVSPGEYRKAQRG